MNACECTCTDVCLADLELPIVNFHFEGFDPCADCPCFRPVTARTVIYIVDSEAIGGSVGRAAIQTEETALILPDLEDDQQLGELEANLTEGALRPTPDAGKYAFVGWMMDGTFYAKGEEVELSGSRETVELSAVYHARVVYHQNREGNGSVESTFAMGAYPKDLAEIAGWQTERFLGWSLESDAREAGFTASDGPALPYTPADLPLHLYAVYLPAPDDHPNTPDAASLHPIPEEGALTVTGQIDYSWDVDWIAVEASLEGLHRFLLDSEDACVRMQVYDAALAEQTLSDDGCLALEAEDRCYLKVSYDPESAFADPVQYTLTVALREEMQGSSTTLDVTAGEVYYLALEGKGLTDLSTPIQITYDSAAFELIDVAAQTYGRQTSGAIAETPIVVQSHEDGTLVISSTEEIPDDRCWSGLITMLEFEALASGTTTLAVSTQ